MLKKIVALLMALFTALAFAAVDVNSADATQLDGVKGIGPAISGKIAAERKKAPFKDWDDLIARVSGIGETSAAKLSEAGLTVNGASFKGLTPKPAAAKPEVKTEAKKEAKAAPAAVETKAAAATAATSADDKKAAAKKAKEEKAAAAKAAKEEAAAAKKKAADDKAAAKKKAAEDKAAATKAAADKPKAPAAKASEPAAKK